MSIRAKLAKPLNDALRPLHVQLVSGTSPDPAIQDFISARKTLAAAQQAGLSLGAYIDRTYAEPGRPPTRSRPCSSSPSLRRQLRAGLRDRARLRALRRRGHRDPAPGRLRDLRDRAGLAAAPAQAAERRDPRVRRSHHGRRRGRPRLISSTRRRSSSISSSTSPRAISRRWPGSCARAGRSRSMSSPRTAWTTRRSRRGLSAARSTARSRGCGWWTSSGGAASRCAALTSRRCRRERPNCSSSAAAVTVHFGRPHKPPPGPVVIAASAGQTSRRCHVSDPSHHMSTAYGLVVRCPFRLVPLSAGGGRD